MKQERPPAARRVRWTPRLLLFLLLLLPLFPGCKGWDTPFGTGADADDPLRPGGAIPTQPNAPAQPQPPSPTAQPAIPTPPPPSNAWAPTTGSTTPTTPAGQAMAAVHPSEPTTDPRYNGLPQGQPADGSGAWGKVDAATGATGNVQLHPPEPASGPGAGSAVSPSIEVRQAGGVQSVESVDQAFLLLDSYGMNWFQLKQDGTNSTNFLFDCYLPNKQDPRLVDYIEGKGSSRLGALRDAIDQINRKQAGK